MLSQIVSYIQSIQVIPLLLVSVIFFILFSIDSYIERFFATKKESIRESIRSTIYETVKIANWFFYICASFAIVHFLYSDVLPYTVEIFVVGVLLVYGARFLQRFSIFSLAFYIEQKTGQTHLTEIELLRNVGVFHIVIRILVWLSAAFLYFSYLQFDITSLVATFGISSIVIAFALQNVLQELFASLSVYLDKPFEVGDYVNTDNEEGVVLKVGIKSTRIRAKTGEIVVVPNKIISESKVRNYRQLTQRKVFSVINVKPTSDTKALEQSIQAIQEHFQKTPEVELERVSILNISEGKIPIEIVFFYNSSDFLQYAKEQTKLSISLIDIVSQCGLELFESVYFK